MIIGYGLCLGFKVMCTEYIQDFGHWWKRDVVATQLFPEDVKFEAFKSVTVADQRAQENVEDVAATQLSPEDVTVEAVKGVADQIAQEGVADQQQPTGVRDGAPRHLIVDCCRFSCCTC